MKIFLLILDDSGRGLQHLGLWLFSSHYYVVFTLNLRS